MRFVRGDVAVFTHVGEDKMKFKVLLPIILAALLAVTASQASDLESSNYSETAASNTAASPNGFPDNIAPSSLKSIVREVMGALKRSWNRVGPSATSSGTNTITLTYTTAPAAYVQGQRYCAIAGGTNTGAATLNVNTLGAKAITKRGTTALSGNEILIGEVFCIAYDGTQFQLLTSGASGVGTNTVANSNLAQMAANTVKGNNTGSTANAADLTVAQTVTMLGVVKTVTRQVFTASGTYTPHAGLIYADVEVLGGGGGGGGTVIPGSGNSGAGAGGGAGGYAKKVLTAATVGASQSVTIGAGGTAGASTGATAGTGGTTSFGSLLSATGGSGGTGTTSGTSTLGSSGGAGGVGSSGDFNANGASGTWCWGSGSLVKAGDGGNSIYGGGGTGPTAAGTVTRAGDPATLYGSGGSGAAVSTTGAAKAGGAGSAGIVIVTEYNSQ